MELTAFSQEAPFSCLVGGCSEPIDTAQLENIHQYIPLTSISLGNTGLPTYSLIPNIDSLFQFKTLSFSPDEMKNVNHFDVKKPFTSASYVLGSKSEQILSILHTQNINKQTNFSFQVNKVKSNGFYINQLTNNIELNSNFWHISKNDHYKVDLTFQFNRIFNEMNGGVESDIPFEEDTLLNRNRELMNVNLENASTTIKQSSLKLGQEFIFLSNVDSLGNGNMLSLGVNLQGTELDKRYKDSILNLDYYSLVLIDSAITNDKNYFREVNGRGYLQFAHSGKSTYTLKPFYNYEIKEVLNTELDTLITNHSIGIISDFKIYNHVFVLNYTQWVNGYRQSDFTIDLKWKSKIKDFKLSANTTLSEYHPSLDLLTYKGNNVSWINSFSSTKKLNVGGKLNYTKTNTSVQVNYSDIDQPIIYNYLGQPQQSLGISQFIQTTLEQKIDLKKYHFNLNGTYQYLGGYQVLNLPSFVGVAQIFKEGKAFKNNLDYMLGVEGVYYSKFEAMNFSPITYTYFLSDEQTIGNYAQINLFLNFRIKSVRLFLKSTHLNSGLFGYRYYGAYNYPLRDRTFQFGLNWNFIN